MATEVEEQVADLIGRSIAVEIEYRGETTREKWQCDEWAVHFKPRKEGGKRWTVPYFTGLGHRRKSPSLPGGKAVRPPIAGVVHSLLSDADSVVGLTFKQWAGALGYSDDSIRALEVYRECQDTGEKLSWLFDKETLARLRELLEGY